MDIRLVNDSEHGYNVPVLGLRDELSDNTDVVQGTLSVGNPHGAVKPKNPARRGLSTENVSDFAW